MKSLIYALAFSFVAASMLLSPLSIAFAVSDPMVGAPIIRQSTTTSSNWSGYAVTASSGSVTDVKGSWVVPAVSCSTTGNQYSSFWVGIDGYSSSSVEQIGTDSDCQGVTPTYYAWYEFYPKPSYYVPSFTVQPNDVITAEVLFNGKSFTVTITDSRTGKTVSLSAKVGKAQRSSAEWIVEAPWSGGVLPLANFGTVYFSNGHATIGSTAASIGSFGSAVQQINMVDKNGNPKDSTSSLSPDGTSFSVKWLSSGP